MSRASANPDQDDPLKALFLKHGWRQSSSSPSSFCRSHEVGDYLWTEEVDISSGQRLSYISQIKAKRSSLDRALGKAASRYARVAGEIFAANIPFKRTGIGKLNAYRQGEAFAKSVSSHLSTDVVGDEKIFLLIHKSPDSLEAVALANTTEEAWIHVNTMLMLSGLSEESSIFKNE